MMSLDQMEKTYQLKQLELAKYGNELKIYKLEAELARVKESISDQEKRINELKSELN